MENYARREKPRSRPHSLEEPESYRDRLKDVIILNEDFEPVSKKYDGVDTFFYFDPPYMDEDIAGDPVEFKERLFKVLSGLRGKWMLSFGDDELVKELFKSFNVRSFSAQSRTTHPYGKRRELLIANYELTIPRALLAKEFDFDLEAIDSKYVADLADGELVSLYKKLHEVYRDRGEVFEALLNASIFAESEMDRRNLKREFDDGLSRETKFWVTEYGPAPEVNA